MLGRDRVNSMLMEYKKLLRPWLKNHGCIAVVNCKFGVDQINITTSITFPNEEGAFMRPERDLFKRLAKDNKLGCLKETDLLRYFTDDKGHKFKIMGATIKEKVICKKVPSGYAVHVSPEKIKGFSLFDPPQTSQG